MAVKRRKGSNSFFLFGIQEEYDDLISGPDNSSPYAAATNKGDKGYLHRRRFPFTRLTLDATGEQSQSESIVGGRADSLNTLDRLSASGDFEGEMLPEDIPYLSELILAPKSKPTSSAVSDLPLQNSDSNADGYVSGTGTTTAYPVPDYPSKVEITGLTNGKIVQIKGFRRTGRKDNRQESVVEYLTVASEKVESKKFYTKFQTDGIRIGTRPSGKFTPDTSDSRPTAANIKYKADTYKTEMTLGVDQSPGATVQMSKGDIPVTAFNVIANQAEYRIGTGGVRILLNLLASNVINETMLLDSTKRILKYNVDPEAGPSTNDIVIASGAISGQSGSAEGSVFQYTGSAWVDRGDLVDIDGINIPASITDITVGTSTSGAGDNNDVHVFSESSGSADNSDINNAAKGSVWTSDGSAWTDRGNLTNISGITTFGEISVGTTLSSSTVAADAALANFPLSNLNYYPRWGGALYYHHTLDKAKPSDFDYKSTKTSAPTPFSDLIIRINQNYEEDDAITGDREAGQPIDSDRGVIEITFEADVYLEAGDSLDDNYARWQQYYKDNSTAILDFFLFNFLDDGRQYLIHVECPVAQLTEIPVITVEGRQQLKRRLVWKCVPTEGAADAPDTIKMTFWTEEQPYAA